jgi:predicted amidophosphoribosyltransferase
MGDTKACLFCGRGVDKSFDYCPHCGYEFGDDEDCLPDTEDALGSGDAGEDGNYLVRLRTLQEILSDMEKELDRIIRISSKDP